MFHHQPVTNATIIVLMILAGASSAPAQDSQPDDAAPLSRVRRRSEPDRQRTPISLDGGASINPDLLGKIQDDTLGLTVDDREPYFRILKLTQRLPAEELQLLAREFREDRHAASKYRKRDVSQFPTFVDLFQHPHDYRGRPVTLHGVLRRLVTYEAGPNDQGFETLYEGWVYPDEGQSHPAVVIFTEKPDQLPIGGDITEEVTVTGYFLKMYGYQAQDAARKAPLVLAHTIRWSPQQSAERWQPSPEMYALVSAVILVIAIAIALGVRESSLRRTAERQARLGQYVDFVPPAEFRESSVPNPSRNGISPEPHH